MKKMSKSLFAMVLVIAMVLSTMPMSFAAEGEVATAVNNATITYDTRAALIAAGHVDVRGESKGRLTEHLTYEKSHGFLQYISDSVNDSYNSSTSRLTAYNAFEFGEGKFIIFEIYVPAAGTYFVKTNTNKKKDTAIFAELNAYIAPKSDSVTAANLLIPDNLIGTVDNDTLAGFTGASPYTSDVSNAQTFKKDGADATYTFNAPGYYNVGFQVVTDDDASKTGVVIFANLHLVSGNGSGYALIGDMTLSADSVKAGESATATATAYKSNDASLATVTYASSNTDVATVDPATGVITTKKAGKTIISATAEGSVNSIEKELEVASANASAVTIKYDLKKLYNDTRPDKTIKFADNITYKNTNGFFKYMNDSLNDGVDKTWRLRWNNRMLEMYQNQWIILEIDVPKAGDYDISMYNGKAPLGGDLSVHIFESDGEKPVASDLNDDNFIGKVDCEDKTLASGKIVQVTTPTYVGSHSFDRAGKYYIGFRALDTDVTPDPLPEGDNAGNYNDTAYVGDIILDGGNGNALIGGVINGVSDTLEIGDTATAAASAYLSKDGTAAANFTYSSDSSAITIDAESGVLTAKAEGKATITATSADALSGCNTITKEVTVKPAEPGESVSDTLVSFTFVSSDAVAGSVSAKGYPTVGEVEIGTSVEATATANNGYEFAYWRNGAGTVLSTNATATFKFNTNTAVYAEFIKLPEEGASEVPVYFYNGNGNLLENKNVAKGTLFGTAKIANPSLTGYKFEGWSVEDNATINTLTRAVALFGDSGETYTVKADEATITSDATYGSEVTVTSNAADFKAWKLGDKIVSYDKAYTFYVWDDVTLTSVTEGEEAPVAVLDEVDGKPMLIYSVPGNCEIIEAGILFGNGAEIGSYESKAFAKEMTGQFTAQPNGEEENKTARGYLIFKKDGTVRVIYAD